MYFHYDRWEKDKDEIEKKEDHMKHHNRSIAVVLLLGMLFCIFQNANAAAPKESKTEYVATGHGNKVTRKEAEITSLYEKGITDKEEQIEARMQKVKEEGLEEFADERYFLSKEYYSRFTIDELEQKGLTLLVDCMTDQEIALWENYVKAKITPMRIERGKDLIAWTNSAGITTRTYAFEVDGNVAFCGDHGKTAPATGSGHSAYIPVVDEKIQKVLYYGYQGPEDQMTKSGYSKSKSYVIMAMLISNFRRGKAPGTNGAIFWNQIKNLPAPPKETGTAYYVETNDNRLQDLFFYDRIEKGRLKIQKGSADPSATEHNQNYCLEGAKYGVYEDPDAVTEELAVLTTKKDGWSQEVSLEEGTYFIKEKQAPKGFEIDETIHTVEIKKEETTTLFCKDIPKMQNIKVFLTKKDAQTGENKPQGMGTLKDAGFIVRYYKGLWDSDPKADGINPDRVWKFKTDAFGQCRYEEEYLTSGDPLFFDKDKISSLPYGTITIEEEKAPEGYLRNDTLYLRQIKEEEEENSIFLKEGIIIPQSVFQLHLLKRAEDRKTMLKGAVFEYISPDGKKEEIVTDEKGSFDLIGLCYGTHQLREKTPPKGYELNENVISFTVDEENQVTLESSLDPKYGKTEFQVEDDGNLLVKMEDKYMSYNLCILKSNGKGKVLQDAEFTMYEDPECKKAVEKSITNEQGKAYFYDLSLKKTYYIKETKAPSGYEKIDKIYKICEEKMPDKKEKVLEVVNEPGELLPDTGSYSMLFIICIGIAMILWVAVRKKD